jgi:hypothetical protein
MEEFHNKVWEHWQTNGDISSWWCIRCQHPSWYNSEGLQGITPVGDTSDSCCSYELWHQQPRSWPVHNGSASPHEGCQYCFHGNTVPLQYFPDVILTSVIFLGKDNSELNNGFPDNVSSPPWMEDYKSGKPSSPR